MLKMFKLASLAMAAMAANFSCAHAFSFSFDWGAIPKCTTGNPNVVNSPMFKLVEIPAGAATINFRLKDIDAPNFNHGGGTVAYLGKPEIISGAFKYQSPCPPNGSHTYVWTATVFDKAGKRLTSASSSQRYP